jgi:hypothetical protein
MAGRVMNLKNFERSCQGLMYYPGISLEGLRKTMTPETSCRNILYLLNL